MRKIPVVFDCDPGLDDAIALVLALARDELDIKAVTTVAGNAPIEATTQNALDILSFCGATDIPVAQGASKPILQPAQPVPDIHGESGLGAVTLPRAETKPHQLTACQMMAAVVEQSNIPVTIIATGPLTNVATFLLANPYLAGKIERIALMGGGFRFGNSTPAAEYNIWCDPEAAQVVMQSGIYIEMYGLDVTHKAMVMKNEFGYFRDAGDKISTFIADILEAFHEHCASSQGGALPGCPIHDACAVAGLCAPRLFDYHQCTVQVDLDGKYTRGATSVDLRFEPRRAYPYNAQIAMDVERPAFLQLLLQAAKAVSEGRRLAQ